VTDRQQITTPGSVFGHKGAIDTQRRHNCTYLAETDCEVLAMPIIGVIKAANSAEIRRLIEAINFSAGDVPTEHLEV